MIERTFVLIKPDAVQRGIVGQIIERFERVGLRIAALKLVWPTKEIVDEHYPNVEQWLRSVGEKALKGYEKQGKKVEEDPIEIGKRVKRMLLDYLTSGPVIAMVLEGNHAVKLVRKIVGPTEPLEAPPGTIRGDFTKDSYVSADTLGRSVRNIIHASDSRKEAEREIRIWFSESEIIDYERPDIYVILGKDYKKLKKE
ncbi:nucleoside-diphosphate kinase [Candidatus Micrarchaeota archaeon]|nr:MAG: nucleoside-diphosphate kinase [Candidatus Micrarchaeota archaeon]